VGIEGRRRTLIQRQGGIERSVRSEELDRLREKAGELGVRVAELCGGKGNTKRLKTKARSYQRHVVCSASRGGE